MEDGDVFVDVSANVDHWNLLATGLAGSGSVAASILLQARADVEMALEVIQSVTENATGRWRATADLLGEYGFSPVHVHCLPRARNCREPSRLHEEIPTRAFAFDVMFSRACVERPRAASAQHGRASAWNS